MADKHLSLGGAVAVLRAAGEETRLRLLHLLAHGELNVKDLTVILAQSQPRISRHLKLLDEAGLVRRHREGNWVYCRLAEQGGVAALSRAVLDRLERDGPPFDTDIARLDELKRWQAANAEQFFNEVAHEWDRVRALQIGEAEVEQAILKLAGAERFDTLLDLGTGTGRMLELFAERIGQGIGVDISHTMLANARAKLSMAGLAHCQVRHGDITRLDQDSGSVDLAVLHAVMHYFDDPLPVLREAARVLAPGGRFLIVDFAPHSMEFLRDEHAHRRLGFNREQVEGWFEEVGLGPVDTVNLNRAAASKGPGLTVTVWLAQKACAVSKDAGQNGDGTKGIAA